MLAIHDNAVDSGLYLLTSDLESKMNALTQIGLMIPSRSFFLEMRDGLRSQLATSLPNVTVECLDMDLLSEEILRAGNERCTLLKEAELVSSCIEVASKRHGITLEVNRIVDERGQVIGLGPRPGHPSLETQIASIARRATGRPLVIAEDGAFTGGTLTHVLQLLEAHHISVNSVVIGFAFPEAITAIKECFSGDLIVIETVGTPLDWMPDHDFYPFVPNCGRTVGVKIYGAVVPFYTMEGASYSIPYIRPFGPTTEWARVPEQAAIRLSAFCLKQCEYLFREIERINETDITIGKLAGVFPRISIPVSTQDCRLPGLEVRVVDYLNDALLELD